MIKTYDGTSFKRLGGKPGDKSPAVGVKRPRTLYTAVGGETSINLSSTSPAISYLPGNAQISVKRSSGGALISGIDFFELTSSSIGFPSTDPLVAGEVVEIIQDVVITAVMAAVVRPDAFTATGVLGQTLITADFSWAYNLNPSKGIGAVEVCLHGLSLTRGVDYTEVNLSVANTNQITLVDPLVGGENIQILPLYQALDTSAAATSFNGTQIASIQAGLSAGTQAFVDTSSLISVPNTTIVGRAPIVNIAADLRASFGVERIQVQSIVQLQNEFGPNGEPVWSAVNDDRGLIRFVGTGWTSGATNGGPSFTSNNVGDYAEITFFGTGLNFLVQNYNSASTDIRISVDGGAEGSNLFINSSNILIGRNYATMSPLQAIQGLSLGVHTAKIRTSVGSYQGYGFEILNTNSTTSLNVNSGSSYLAGQKLTSSSASAIAYNSAFETGTLGTRGGHVVVYQKSDGTIGKAVTAVNASSAFTTSADHTNEEMYRQYSYREFGAGRADDFSSPSTATSLYVFTLDDGTTSLVGSSVALGNPFQGIDGCAFGSTAAYLTFTFVGTGLDAIITASTSSTGAYSLTVDGVSQGTVTLNALNGVRNYKIASGLPYGTHVAKLTLNTATSTTVVGYRVYQPKKPSTPTGAIELADYNVMANYVADTSAANCDLISTGVLHKESIREVTFVGAWSAGTSTVVIGGWFETSVTAGDSVSYTFFGTGLDIVGAGVSASINVKIDGASYTGAATAAGTSTSWTPGTSTWLPANNNGGKLQIAGLTLGLHTVKLTLNTAVNLYLHGFQVITPIYSAKSNTTYDQQNTLPVGSNSLSDNRKTSLIKDSALQKKNISQAIGVASSPTTTSGAFIPMPDMSITHLNTTGRIKISWSGLVTPSIANTNINTIIYVDGTGVSLTKAVANGAGYLCEASDIYYMPISPGTHKIDIYWSTNGGTATANSNLRSLLVEEI